MEKKTENTIKEDIMIRKGDNACLCLVCNSVYLENPDDPVFKSLKRKEFVICPGTTHNFGDHLTTGIHGEHYQDPPHKSTPPKTKPSPSSLFTSTVFSPFSPQSSSTSSSSTSSSSTSSSTSSAKFGIPDRFYKKSTSSFKITPPNTPPLWLRLLVKLSFMIVFFIVQEKMSDNSFKRFLDFTTLVMNTTLDFFGGSEMMPFGFRSCFRKYLHIMAVYAIRNREAALSVTKFFSISFDETTDVARTGIIMFFITFFDLNYNLVTEYLTTLKVGKGGGKAKGLFETLKKVLIDNKLLYHFLVSVTTDGVWK
jgi:hypothetical protein